MSDESPRPRFAVDTRAPGAAAVQRVAIVVSMLFEQPGPRWVWMTAARVLMAIAITAPLLADQPLWLQVIVVVVAIILLVALQSILVAITRRPAVRARLMGRPTFQALDFMPLRTFAYILNCVEGLGLDFTPADRRVIRAMAEMNERSVRRALEREYIDRYGEAGWKEAWAEIGQAKVGEMTMLSAIRTGMTGTIMLNTRILGDYLVVFLGIYGALAFWFLSDAIIRRDLLLLTQVTLVSGLVISGFTFLMSTVGLREIAVVDPEMSSGLTLSSEAAYTTDDQRARAQAILDEVRDLPAYTVVRENAGRILRPRVEIRPLYIRSVRDLTLRQCFLESLSINALVAVVLGIEWGLALLWSRWTDAVVNTWMTQMLLGALLLPVAISVAVLLGFWLFTRFDRFLVILVGVLTTAVLPAAIAYVFGGASRETAGLTVIVTAALGAIPLAIAQLAKSSAPAP